MVLPNTHKHCLASQAKQESKNSVVGFSSSVLVSLTGVQTVKLFFQVFQILLTEVLTCSKRHPTFSQVNIFPGTLSQRDLDIELNQAANLSILIWSDTLRRLLLAQMSCYTVSGRGCISQVHFVST